MSIDHHATYVYTYTRRRGYTKNGHVSHFVCVYQITEMGAHFIGWADVGYLSERTAAIAVIKAVKGTDVSYSDRLSRVEHKKGSKEMKVKI